MLARVSTHGTTIQHMGTTIPKIQNVKCLLHVPVHTNTPIPHMDATHTNACLWNTTLPYNVQLTATSYFVRNVLTSCMSLFQVCILQNTTSM